MSVTKQATVEVATSDLRHALASVGPHHRKGMREDAKAQHRIRMIFANGQLFVAASNEVSTALARLPYASDSRGNIWETDDGPLLVDLQPRFGKQICNQFSVKASASDVDQMCVMHVDTDDGDITLTDVGGLWSSGIALTLPFPEPHESFPDVIDITGRAFAEVQGDQVRGRSLVQDGRAIAAFAAATIQYQAPLRIRQIGAPEQNAGFLVQCGPYFSGTISSANDDDGLKTREKTDLEWIRLLNPRKLASA